MKDMLGGVLKFPQNVNYVRPTVQIYYLKYEMLLMGKR